MPGIVPRCMWMPPSAAAFWWYDVPGPAVGLAQAGCPLLPLLPDCMVMHWTRALTAACSTLANHLQPTRQRRWGCDASNVFVRSFYISLFFLYYIFTYLYRLEYVRICIKSWVHQVYAINYVYLARSLDTHISPLHTYL